MEHVQPENGDSGPRDDTRSGSHVDPEVLALLALGEEVGDASDRAHLDACEQCLEEVASLAAVVLVGRGVSPADAPVPAPRAVWEGIRAELALPAELEPDGTRPRAAAVADAAGLAAASPSAAHPTPLRDPAADDDARPHGAPSAPGTSSGGSSDGASVTSLADRRPRGASRLPWVLGAAAAGVLIGGAGGTLIAANGPGETPNEPPLVAQAALDGLPGYEGASGEAAVHQTADGTRILVVDVEADPNDDGFREVWLIDENVERMVSLGVIQGDSGTLVIPADLDLGEYPVVDVSDEPYDGNPLHSGVSVIRGVLDA